MTKLSAFVAMHRSRFVTNQNNTFAFSWGKVFRRVEFLRLIIERYASVSRDYVFNQTELQKGFQPGEHPVSQEQQQLFDRGTKLGNELHLLIESSYLFSKIVLDDVARAIEYYFGAVSKVSLDSHDDLSKKIESYTERKSLIVSLRFVKMIGDLKSRICDFRDYQIAHEKSPRTMAGTTWGDSGVRISINKLYPKETDTQVDSESPDQILSALEAYLDQVTTFLETNDSKTNLTLETK